MIQLFASKLVMFTKPVVSARGALDGSKDDGGGGEALTFSVLLLFRHWFVRLSKC